MNPTTTRAVSVVPSTTTTTTSNTNTNSSTNNNNNNKNSNEDAAQENQLDFIGPSHAVKSLFSVPYATDKSISVAVHNMQGTLLIDVAETDHDDEATNAPPRDKNPTTTTTRRRPRPASFDRMLDTSPSPPPSLLENASSSDTTTKISQDTRALVSTMLNIPPEALDNNNNNYYTERHEQYHHHHHNHEAPVALLRDTTTTTTTTTTAMQEDLTSRFPPPEQYPPVSIPALPREYLQWKFRELQLMVGSDAMVYRNSTATTVRVTQAQEMQDLLHQHQDMVQRGKFQPDHRFTPTQQRGKTSYAQAVQPNHQQHQHPKTLLESSSSTSSTTGSFAAPDLDRVQLQTCIVPAPANTTALLPTMDPTSASSSSSSLPVCTVLDAYLDNIMANVPQLALCLQEKGFIRSVKLLETQDIPSTLLVPSTLDTSSSSDSFTIQKVERTAPQEPLFSPHIMEMNAATLLRFLKANCTRDNATYLLRREAGHTNIELYDVSSISAQRQRKWIWWLAMMSYRFALRLGQLTTTTTDDGAAAQRRSFRARQRSLLQNALNLLEELADMDGGKHETLCAAVAENLADTFLQTTDDNDQHHDNDHDEQEETTTTTTTQVLPGSHQPYATMSVDALNKAHDHLNHGIKTLWPLLDLSKRKSSRRRRRDHHHHHQGGSEGVAVDLVSSGSSEDDDDDEDSVVGSSSSSNNLEQQSITLQLFGLHHKLINVSLRLAEHHLKNYWSSSAMQALRTAARKMVDASSLLKGRNVDKDDYSHLETGLRYQFTWLWAHCGHFARSFAADPLWRDRGHACGDDVVSVLRDVEAAISREELTTLEPLDEEMTTLSQVNGVVCPESFDKAKAIPVAARVLNRQKQIQRDERRVLVAASICYRRSIGTLEAIKQLQSDGMNPRDRDVLNLLRQRLGDACNETGKIMLNELRRLMKQPKDKHGLDADQIVMTTKTLLCSAQYWFETGLDAFEACSDLRNIALLRCNLCQCCKFRANSNFANRQATPPGGASHAEMCLQEAADHLQAGHESLGQRDVDPMTWDMVSQELGATFLVLGVRRRQSLLGGGTTPVLIQALRLSPGKERSIVEPMEKALKIYQESGNAHQAAAAHYQLALFYSKVWTCQRDESKTRDKLASAFSHFHAAHSYFSSAPPGNESTFVILCLDLANLYSSVSGEESSWKALCRCLDTTNAFSPKAVDGAKTRSQEDWFQTMSTLATSVEDRVFKLLMGLVKIEKDANKGCSRYKDLYRVALTSKMTLQARLAQNEGIVDRIAAFHDMLSTIQEQNFKNKTSVSQ